MIFISHSSADSELIRLLNQFLNSIGVKKEYIFCSSFEGQGVKNGHRIADNVLEQINQSNILIYVVTNNFLKSVYCTQELGIGWASQKQNLFIFKSEDVNSSEIKGFVSTDYKYSSFDSNGMSSLYDELTERGYDVSKKFSIINDSINSFLNSVKSIVSILVETKDLTEKEANEVKIRNLQKQYQYLSLGAKTIVADIYFSRDGVKYYSMQNGVVGALIDKLFIRRTTSISIGFYMFGYELQPWVIDFIKENNNVEKELQEINKKKRIPQVPEI